MTVSDHERRRTQQPQVLLARSRDALALPPRNRRRLDAANPGRGRRAAQLPDDVAGQKPSDVLIHADNIRPAECSLSIARPNAPSPNLTGRMNTLQDRFQLAMEGPPKVKQADLARACGVKPPTVWAWVKGDAKSLEATHLMAAALKLGVRPEWLASGKGPMRPQSGSGTKLERQTSALWHSYAMRLDPHILSDTLYWVEIEEANGPAYGAGELLGRIADLYAMHEVEPGGRLSIAQHDRLKEAAANRTGGKKDGKRGKGGPPHR